MTDVAVIGAGIVGAAIAHRLAGKGVDVLLLDRAEPGGAATAATLGGISARAQTPRAYFDLCLAGMEEYRRFAWSLAPAPWYHADGTLAWYIDPAAEAALAAEMERLRDWGYSVEQLSPSRVITELVPNLAGGSIDQAGVVAWFPTEAWVVAPALARHLAEATRNENGHVLTGPTREVVAIETAGGRVTGLTLQGGQSVPVRAVVNAAGIAGGEIAAMVGRNLPVTAPRGLALRVATSDDTEPLRQRIHTDRVALRPDGPGHVLMVPLVDPGTLPPGPVPLTDPVVTEILANATAALPALATATPVETISAPWPLLADGLPSVGAAPEVPGYFEAVTDYGVTLAPLIARSLADEITGQQANPLLAPFSPARFSSG